MHRKRNVLPDGNTIRDEGSWLPGGAIFDTLVAADIERFGTGLVNCCLGSWLVDGRFGVRLIDDRSGIRLIDGGIVKLVGCLLWVSMCLPYREDYLAFFDNLEVLGTS